MGGLVGVIKTPRPTAVVKDFKNKIKYLLSGVLNIYMNANFKQPSIYVCIWNLILMFPLKILNFELLRKVNVRLANSLQRGCLLIILKLEWLYFTYSNMFNFLLKFDKTWSSWLLLEYLKRSELQTQDPWEEGAVIRVEPWYKRIQ